MKFYLSAERFRRPEMQHYRLELQGMGHQVVSCWLDWDLTGMPQATPVSFDQEPLAWSGFAEVQCADIETAEVLVEFSGNGGRGERSAHMGFALGYQITVVLIGPREHLLHTHPAVLVYDSWRKFLDHISMDQNWFRWPAGASTDHLHGQHGT